MISHSEVEAELLVFYDSNCSYRQTTSPLMFEWAVCLRTTNLMQVEVKWSLPLPLTHLSVCPTLNPTPMTVAHLAAVTCSLIWPKAQLGLRDQGLPTRGLAEKAPPGFCPRSLWFPHSMGESPACQRPTHIKS